MARRQSFDPMLNVLYVNVNEAPTINRLRAVHELPGDAEQTPRGWASSIYERTASAAMAAERQGAPPQTPGAPRCEDDWPGDRDGDPAGAQQHASVPQFRAARAERAGRVSEQRADHVKPRHRPHECPTGTRSTAIRCSSIQHGVPAISPPWGTLNAIDLVKGEILWKVPLGEYPQLVAKGIRNTGTLNFGGAVATAGGVIFVAATADEKIPRVRKALGTRRSGSINCPPAATPRRACTWSTAGSTW